MNRWLDPEGRRALRPRDSRIAIALIQAETVNNEFPDTSSMSKQQQWLLLGARIKETYKGSGIKDLISDWGRAVKNKFELDFFGFLKNKSRVIISSGRNAYLNGRHCWNLYQLFKWIDIQREKSTRKFSPKGFQQSANHNSFTNKYFGRRSKRISVDILRVNFK